MTWQPARKAAGGGYQAVIFRSVPASPGPPSPDLASRGQR